MQLEQSYVQLEAENGTYNLEYTFNNQVPVSLTDSRAIVWASRVSRAGSPAP